MSQLRTYAVYMLVPLCAFALTVLLQLVALCLPSMLILRKVYSVTHILYSLGAIVANCWFVAVLYSYNLTLSACGLAVIFFWIASNFGYSTLIAYIRWTQLGDPSLAEGLAIALVSLIGIPDLSFHHILRSDRRVIELVDCLRLANGYFFHLPFLILEFLSLRIYSPPVTLMAIFFNCLSLALLCAEMIHWIVALRQASAAYRSKRLSSAMRVPLLNPLDSGNERPPPPVSLRLLTMVTFPLVVVTYLPHAASLVGIPFVIESLRRFGKATSEEREDIQADFTWFGKRGYFLVALNVISLVVVVVVLLPLLSLVSLLLLFLVPLSRLRGPDSPTPFADFQASVLRLLAALIFTYFPFTSQPPLIKGSDPAGFAPPELPPWKQVVAAGWVLVFEVIIPVLSACVGIRFSLQLYHVHSDPYLTDRDALFSWMVVSFCSSGLGLLLELIWLLFWAGYLGRARCSREKLVDVITTLSPYGNSLSAPVVHRALRFLIVWLDNFPHLLAAIFTISYIGIQGPLWAVQVSCSIFSLSFFLGKLLAGRIFGNDITKPVRFGIHVTYFILFVVTLALATYLGSVNRYCDLTRWVDTALELEEVAGCSSLSSGIMVASYEEDVTVNFQVEEVTNPVLIVSNVATLDITFGALTSIQSTFYAMENSGGLELSFPALQVLGPNSLLNLYHNTAVKGIHIPLLHALRPLSSFEVEQEVASVAFRLQALITLDGVLQVKNSSFTGVEFSLITSVGSLGGVIVVDCPNVDHLSLDSLEVLAGALAVVNNPSLVAFSLPHLQTAPGQIFLHQNAGLQTATLGGLITAGLTLSVVDNAVLREVNLSVLEELDGVVLLQNNTALTSVRLDALRGMGPDARLIIEENPSLVVLKLPSLDCTGRVSLEMRGNTNLEEVWLPARCIPQVVQENNPKLEFVIF